MKINDLFIFIQQMLKKVENQIDFDVQNKLSFQVLKSWIKWVQSMDNVTQIETNHDWKTKKDSSRLWSILIYLSVNSCVSGADKDKDILLILVRCTYLALLFIIISNKALLQRFTCNISLCSACLYILKNTCIKRVLKAHSNLTTTPNHPEQLTSL